MAGRGGGAVLDAQAVLAFLGLRPVRGEWFLISCPSRSHLVSPTCLQVRLGSGQATYAPVDAPRYIRLKAPAFKAAVEGATCKVEGPVGGAERAAKRARPSSHDDDDDDGGGGEHHRFVSGSTVSSSKQDEHEEDQPQLVCGISGLAVGAGEFDHDPEGGPDSVHMPAWRFNVG